MPKNITHVVKEQLEPSVELTTDDSTSMEYVQYYLHEFCYKFNRRYFGEKLFDRVVIAAITYKY